MSSKSSFSSNQVVASFVLGSALTYIYLKTCQKKSTSKITTTHQHVSRTKQITIPPDMRSEQLSRNHLYFGEDGMESIINSSILVVGLGGVGSHTAHMLARAGVSHLRLIDFDQVTLSSLNRHACATLEDVGSPKVDCLKNFLGKVCGDCCDIDARAQMYTGDKNKDGDLLDHPIEGKKWDIVIDAIDDVPTKAQLVAHCVRHNIRVISCMGAGGKSDMTRLHISDLRTASRDPLATKLRQVLRKQLKNDPDVTNDSYLSDVDKVAVIYSSEKVVCKLADLTETQKDEPHKFGAVDNMRVRVIPVLGTMPAIMGQSLAAMSLCELGGKPFSPMSGERLGRNARNRLYQHFKNRENQIRDFKESGEKDTDGIWVGPLQIDVDDVDYVHSEVWRNRCCVSGESLGTVLELSRWDFSKPSNCTNIVLLGGKAMKRFDEAQKKTGDGRSSVAPGIRQIIEDRLKFCRIDSRA